MLSLGEEMSANPQKKRKLSSGEEVNGNILNKELDSSSVIQQDLKKLKLMPIQQQPEQQWTPTKFTISTRSGTLEAGESESVEERYKSMNSLLHQLHLNRHHNPP